MCHISHNAHPAEVVLIAGSPAHPSRSTAALEQIHTFLQEEGVRAHLLAVRYLPAEALLYGDADQAEISAAVRRITAARAVVIATPVTRSAYSGALKAFLDLLPPEALADKLVLSLATGDSPRNLLALEDALKPVLASLGARQILTSIYLTDSQMKRETSGAYHFEESSEKRLRNAASELVRRVHGTAAETEQTPAARSMPSLWPKSARSRGRTETVAALRR